MNRVYEFLKAAEPYYLATFTYDSKKHTEESFKKGLRSCLSTFAKRRGWKYMGVWERSPQKQRLHFHGIFYQRL